MQTRCERIAQLVRGPDVLDVGCAGHILKPGSPYWLHGILREKFPALWGLDVNRENIEGLMSYGYENIFQASAENFSLDKHFDTIVAGELIEHLSNPGLFFSQCKKHLKPDGCVVLSTPYVFSLLYIFYALYKYPKTCQNDEHAFWFCPETLQELAGRYGFRARYWELVEDYEFDNNSKFYLLFARLITTIGRVLLPARLRKNTMIFVFSQE